MRVTATEAKNRFGSLCAQAKREPVFVEKAGQLDTVILSAEHYQALKAHHEKAGRAARRKAFETEFADWIAAQNTRFETHGIPGADHYAAPLPAKLLRRPVDNVSAQASALVSAMDAVVSGV